MIYKFHPFLDKPRQHAGPLPCIKKEELPVISTVAQRSNESIRYLEKKVEVKHSMYAEIFVVAAICGTEFDYCLKQWPHGKSGSCLGIGERLEIRSSKLFLAGG
jgi:hypothetical protein